MDADDDDEGWAGHHEEVDYTKEVVFEDSSDEESNGDKRDQLVAGRQQSEVRMMLRLAGELKCIQLTAFLPYSL